MFWFSGSLTEALGQENILVLSLLCAGIRFYLLQNMVGPMQGYIAETIRGSIFGAFWSTATIYVSAMVPPSLRAVILLVLSTVYNGCGRSLGSLIGGRMQVEMGTERLFWGCAMANLTFAVVLSFYYHVPRRRKKSKQE